MMTDELILHLWDAFVGDTTLTARPLNDDDKIAFANAVLNAAKESDARRREKAATHEPVTFTPWGSLPWKPKAIGYARVADIERYDKVLTIKPIDSEHQVAVFTRDQLQRAVSAMLAAFENAKWVDLGNRHELDIAELISQRDYRDEIIDRILDAVLGKDRPEWSSAYSFHDAACDVEEHMARVKFNPYPPAPDGPGESPPVESTPAPQAREPAEPVMRSSGEPVPKAYDE